ncbi:MAG: hypothetical protein K0S86_3159 [Geminicoccaceae bacterium]|nr:hypothetical protein [Geminicoccaceae bacterium]
MGARGAGATVLPREFRVVAVRDVPRFGVDLATDFRGGVDFATDGAGRDGVARAIAGRDVTARGGSGREVDDRAGTSVRGGFSEGPLASATRVGSDPAVDGAAALADEVAAEVVPPEATVVGALSDEVARVAASRDAVSRVGSEGGGAGARRITEGGGSHGSRGLSTGTGAKSVAVVAESAPGTLPVVRVVVSAGVASAMPIDAVSLMATVVIAESALTTPVETISLITTPESVGDAWYIVCGSLAESATTTAVESAAGINNVGFAAGSSSRTRNAPMPRLRKAATPMPFQTYGPIAVFSGGVPHHLHTPALSG